MAWQEFALRLIELLRPRFYNQITWLVVVGGLAMMSTQLWELVAIELLKREFDISVSGSNDAAWGFALCVLGLAYHMANSGFYELLKDNTQRARNEQERVHDLEIFREARRILNDQQIEDFVTVLQCDHAYCMDMYSQVNDFARFLAQTSNRLLTPSIATASEKYLVAWREARSFLVDNFFVHPNNQTEPPLRLCMDPRLNMDREGDGSTEQNEEYDHLTSELQRISDQLIVEYRTLRNEFKNVLVI
ncbi:hypothetical protein [Synechococcus sp. BO 8801]|uniref:hypothetical protein n=1 Tax=Synechococcus sp. BO 8801 TaxID=169670 RepID=UPI00117DEBFF|nr:hypothetical protein [Synechococcus sp. BO 8801]